MLLVDGLAVFTSYDNHLYFNPVFSSLGFELTPVWHQFSDWALVAVYLPFLGVTLNTPLVAPLKKPVVANTILVVGLLFAFALFWMPDETRAQFNVPFYMAICFGLTWGFVAALHAWLGAHGEAEKARARAFTFAFGLRDLVWAVTFAILVAYEYGFMGDGFDTLIDKSDPMGIVTQLLYQGVVVFYVPLIAYGMLRTQLFDIDLRIKRGLKRGTVAAIVFTIFFVISELASNLLSDQFGTVIGVLAAGVLVFFLDPLFRFADVLSDAAMPNTNATPEYETFRKLQVYDAAVRTAFEGGGISERERRLLDSMIETLRIDRASAEKIESDMLMHQSA